MPPTSVSGTQLTPPPDPIDELFGDASALLYGASKTPVRCRRCNRELTHPDSRRRGIGPICMARDIAESGMSPQDQLTALEQLYSDVRETGESSGLIQEMIEALRQGKPLPGQVATAVDPEPHAKRKAYVRCHQCEWEGWVDDTEDEPLSCGCCDAPHVSQIKPPEEQATEIPAYDDEPDEEQPRRASYPQDPDDGERWVRHVFEELFPARLPGYEAREPQIKLAVAIARSLATGEHLVSEAGTGTGKSLAYLVPAIWFARKSNRPVVVTTGTIALQEQISGKDIPFLQRILTDLPFQAALVKGKGNFLCLDRLEGELKQPTFFGNPDLEQIARWARDTKTGDKSEITYVPPADVWGAVNVDDTCSKKECPYYHRCHFFKAKDAWARADILVCNHALFFADLSIKGDSAGGAGILPQYSAVVFDEAHHIEPVAGEAFGVEITPFKVPAVIKDIRKLRHPDTPEQVLRQLEEANRLVFQRPLLVDQPIDKVDVRRLDPLTQEQLRYEIAHLVQKLLDTEEALANLSWQHSDEKSRQKCEKYQGRLLTLQDALVALSTPTEGYVKWISVERKADKPPKPVLHLSPISVAASLREYIWDPAWSTISTSATISTGGTFDYFKQQVGLDKTEKVVQELLVDSPFDYRTQARLYIPRGLPEPKPENEEAYQAAIIPEILDSLQVTGGRAFLLFTSYRGLQSAYDALADTLRATGMVVMKQGDLPRTQLVQQFKDTHAAGRSPVLFATGTFWEGIDIQGEALSCVMIDKIPFARPDDPVTMAKLDAIEQRGGNKFMEWSVPEAAIKLKQGVGRLIRTRSDRGIVVILDPRLRTKPYGRVFLNSLPPMPEVSYLVGMEEWMRGGS